MENIGKSIEMIRKKIGYSRKYIAENICDESTIYRIEKGQQIPRLDVLQKICHKLNVSVDYVLSLNEDTSYTYINKLKKLCREFLYKQEFDSIQFLIEEAEIFLENNPTMYDKDLSRFIAWQKAILLHKIDQQPKIAETHLKNLLRNRIINELDINIANSLALVLIDLNKEKEAYYLLKEGMKILEHLPMIENKSLYPRVSYNLIYIYYNRKEYYNCLAICHRLEYYLDSNHLFYSTGELYHLLGITYEKKRDLENSYHYFNKTASMFLFEDKDTYYIRTTIAIAEVCFQMKKYEEAHFRLEGIMQKINQLEDPTIVKEYKNRMEKLKDKFRASGMS